MNQAGGFPLLTLILAVNGLGALTIWFVPARRADMWRWLAFLVAATIFFISLFLYMGWDTEKVLQFVEGPVPWLTILDFQYHLGIDGINLHLIMLTTFCLPMVLLGIWGEENKAYVAWLLVCETGLLGALMSRDLFWFVLFGSLALLAGSMVLGNDPRPDEQAQVGATRPASGRYLLSTGVIIALLLVAVGSEAWASNPGWAQTLQFVVIMAAMGIVSMGLPYQLARTIAQRPVSPSTCVLVNGVLSALGIYGMLRFAMLALPPATAGLGSVIMLIGTVVAAWNALTMLGSQSLETALTRWTIAQVGLDMIGMFVQSQLGLLGVILRTVGRALGLSLVLFSSGQAPRRTVERVAPAVGFLTLLGMPGLATFPGLSAWWMAVLRRRWQVNVPPWLNQTFDWGFYALVTLIWLVTAWGLLKIWRAQSQADRVGQMRRALIIWPLLIVIMVIGLRPQPFLDMVSPTLHNAFGEFNLKLQDQLEKPVPEPTNSEQTSAIWPVVQVDWRWPA